jgi:hypothetical protein
VNKKTMNQTCSLSLSFFSFLSLFSLFVLVFLFLFNLGKHKLERDEQELNSRNKVWFQLHHCPRFKTNVNRVFNLFPSILGTEKEIGKSTNQNKDLEIQNNLLISYCGKRPARFTMPKITGLRNPIYKIDESNSKFGIAKEPAQII